MKAPEQSPTLEPGLPAALAANRNAIEAGQWVDLDVAGRPVVVVPDDMVADVRRRLAGVQDGLTVVPERRRGDRRTNQPGDHRASGRDRRGAVERAVVALSRSEALKAIESFDTPKPASPAEEKA